MNEDRKLALLVWLLIAVLFTSILGLTWVMVQLLKAA